MWSEFLEVCSGKGISIAKGIATLLKEHLHTLRFHSSKPAQDASYLEFIRNKPCLQCNTLRRSEAHHISTGGMGMKTDDYRTVPLCHTHHMEFHASHGDERKDLQDWYTKEALNCLVEYIKLVFGGKDG